MSQEVEKLKIILNERNEVEVIGNRAGLRFLADMCSSLSELPESDEEAKAAGNHFHFADYMNTAEEGSMEMIVVYKPDL